MQTEPSSTPQPATQFVLFGALGDLAWRLVVPALFNLHLDNRLRKEFWLIGVDREVALPGLASAGLHRDKANTRIVVEKPLGRDLATFCVIDENLGQNFAELLPPSIADSARRGPGAVLWSHRQDFTVGGRGVSASADIWSGIISARAMCGRPF